VRHHHGHFGESAKQINPSLPKIRDTRIRVNVSPIEVIRRDAVGELMNC
jgi:hypothetical protein